MGRFYTVAMDQVAVSAIQDLFEINAPADAVVRIHKAFIGQHTDVGDAESESLPILISRSTGTSGSGGTAPTAQPTSEGSAAFGGTVEINNTTQATTIIVLEPHIWNLQAGWFYEPTPEEMIDISPSSRLVFELPVAPTDAVTVSGFVKFEEIGG